MHSNWTKEDVNYIKQVVRQTLVATFANHADFDDFVQESLMHVFANRNKIPAGPTRYAYLRRMILHCVYDMLRRNLKENPGYQMPIQCNFDDHEMELRVCEELTVYQPEISDPYVQKVVYETVSQLSPEHRQVLLLKAADFKYKTIAAILNLSVGTVRSRLHWAKKICARQLAPHLA